MKLDMQEELNTVNHSRSYSAQLQMALLHTLALQARPLPQRKPDRVKPRGLTGKQWGKRKQRSKMAKQSRKANRKVG